MARITRRQLTNLLGALGVVVMLAGLAFGLPALDRSLPSQRAVPSDQPYPIGAGVTVIPPAGSTVDLTGTRPGTQEGKALFRLGPVQYEIDVRPFEGNLTSAAERFRKRITGTPGYQVTGAQLGVTTADGLAGVQGSYTAPGRGGRYAVYVTGGLTIEITVSGADLDLGRSLPSIEDSAKTLRRDGEPE
ncbi:hypothetical protein [Actinoplanes sp. NPDC051411]|jgi:hypothetical protein|uniref:hypothetical protein n=1 Tax=Actinoplanes sp. NPDC051411 TaxID=3155522 RepID=UPI00341F328C